MGSMWNELPLHSVSGHVISLAGLVTATIVYQLEVVVLDSLR
jgi:hypothetical protein